MSLTAVVVTIYFFILIGWSLYNYIKNKQKGGTTLEGQFVGTRSYSAGHLLATLVAVWGSNYTLLAAAEAGYVNGISGVIWYALGVALPLFFFSWPLNIATRIRKLLPNGVTIVEVIGKRYDEKSRLVALSILIASNVLFIISIVLSIGIVLKALLGTSLSTAIIIGGVVMIIYTALGGFEALMYAHVFQLALAGGAVLVALFLSISEFSLSSLFSQISADSTGMLNVVAWGPNSMLDFFLGLLGFTIASPILYQIAFSGKNDKEVTRAFRLFGITWAPFAVGTAIMGMVAYLLYPNIQGQDAATTLVTSLFPEWAAVLFFLGGLALVFSTADATVNNVASLIILDIYKKYSNSDITAKKASILSMTTQVSLGVIGILGALNFGDGVLQLLALNGAVNIPLIFTVIFGLYWKRTHPTAAFWAMLLGVISEFILYYGFDKSIYTSFAGLVLSVFILVVGSLMLTRNNTDYLTPMVHKNSEGGGEVA
ncbi:sodium:solute symporter [Alteribacillus sp. YIM 98480]|uniref:sodium:solute symporter family protein n=1 Tax=Alteribacillus sp. YIM 98480 TaxID=2606599 RepID=UPI00131E4145|nr:sodium:solute symporter family protein [Alteribacillus sp. YIM 98480]